MPPNTLRYLVESGHAAPSADNSQPWHFLWDGEILSIRYDSERVQGLTFPPQSPATRLAMGGVIENIVQAAEFMGLPLIPDLLPEANDTSGCYAGIRITANGKDDRETEQPPLFDRHTNRFPFKRAPIPAETIKRLTDFSDGGVRIVAFSEPAPIEKVATIVRAASEVRFQTREVHEWLRASLRFSKQDVEKADGLDVRTLDLPPGGGQFLRFISDWRRMKLLNRIGAYRILAKLDSKPIHQAPLVAAIVAPMDPEGSLAAGRLLTRVWIFLNSVGIAVHPYYVVSDQLARLKELRVPGQLVGQVEEIHERSGKLFELGPNETLYMLLRVGYPTREPPRSLRLPLDKVFTDLTKV